MRTKNKQIVEQILDNLMEVERLRFGPNELVFSEVFLSEHKQLIGRLSSITGLPIEKINKIVRKRLEAAVQPAPA